jgi:hypothetical protein
MSQSVNDILKLADEYYTRSSVLEKVSFIRKLPDGKYRVHSEKGKNLGTYNTRARAKKRLQEIEYFKHNDTSSADDSAIDLTKVEDFSYSALMRQLRKNATPEQVRLFLQMYHVCFEKAVKADLQKPERVALQNALIQFNKKHKINIDHAIIKNAATTELGDAVAVGKYLANMIRFILLRITPEKRQKATHNVKNKIYYLNESDLSTKNLPASSAMGQSITLVKNVLFNHDARYIREVLNNLVRNL